MGITWLVGVVTSITCVVGSAKYDMGNARAMLGKVIVAITWCDTKPKMG